MAKPALKSENATTASSKAAPNRARYEDDFYSWLIEQAEPLRANRLEDLDLDHLAEELEGLSKSEFAKLQSAPRVRVMHMLKWDQLPEHRAPSWIFSIREQRQRYDRILGSNSGLESRVDEALRDAYPDARDWASNETHLPADEFPTECPYPWEDILERPFDFDSMKK